jgi:predicted enzyme related to lactoylglutathione lyase
MFSHLMIGANDMPASKKFYDAIFGTIGFLVESPAQGDVWHAAGLVNGGSTLEDAPGIRKSSPIYPAYLKDPAGNKICALHSVSDG